jgi:hypothetical protein
MPKNYLYKKVKDYKVQRTEIVCLFLPYIYIWQIKKTY